MAKYGSAFRPSRRRRAGSRRSCHRGVSSRDRRRRRRCHPLRRLPGRVELGEVLLHRTERSMSVADEGTLRAAPLDLGSGMKLLYVFD